MLLPSDHVKDTRNTYVATLTLFYKVTNYSACIAFVSLMIVACVSSDT